MSFEYLEVQLKIKDNQIKPEMQDKRLVFFLISENGRFDILHGKKYCCETVQGSTDDVKTGFARCTREHGAQSIAGD